MIGARVMGHWSDGSWYPGMVTEQRDRRGEQQYFVRFDDGDTAWLTLAQIQVLPTAAESPRGLKPFPGARVMGDWAEDSWYSGYVAEANGPETLFFVQFDDGDSKWLPPAKIRPHGDRPNAPPTPPLTVGTPVQGEWSEDSWYPGVVARANHNATMFFIQFDDGDHKWLPASQLRFDAAAPQATHPPSSAPMPASYGTPVPVPVSAPPGHVPPAAVDPRCAYCNSRVARTDLSRCSECGAKL